MYYINYNGRRVLREESSKLNVLIYDFLHRKKYKENIATCKKMPIEDIVLIENCFEKAKDLLLKLIIYSILITNDRKFVENYFYQLSKWMISLITNGTYNKNVYKLVNICTSQLLYIATKSSKDIKDIYKEDLTNFIINGEKSLYLNKLYILTNLVENPFISLDQK